MEDVIVIGAGQAGLALARCLQRRGREAVLLDADQPGEAWRRRYDSLVLFTPSQYSALPDAPFPLPADRYPTKDQVADYLADYARRHRLTVRSHCRVSGLRALDGGGFHLQTDSGGGLRARRVVVATGALQRPAVPSFAAHLDAGVHQLHTSAYRRPSDLPPGRLVIVGAGNSGAQIAEELCRVRDVVMAFDRLPKRFPQRVLGRDIFWWFLRAGVMDRTRSAERDARDVVGAIPLIGTDLPRLLRRGAIARLARVVGASGRQLQIADGRRTEVDVVLWATGFRNDFSWIDVPGALDAAGMPRQHRGVGAVPGLHFLGLPGWHTKGSAFIGFVGRDADYLAGVLAAA